MLNPLHMVPALRKFHRIRRRHRQPLGRRLGRFYRFHRFQGGEFPWTGMAATNHGKSEKMMEHDGKSWKFMEVISASKRNSSN